MFFALTAAALAAEPPSLDAPVVSGTRNKKDVALVVGVEDYAAFADAYGARADAEAMSRLLVATRGLDPDRVTLLTDPTADGLRDGVAAAAKGTKRGGMLWIYWSGHGAVVDGSRVLLGADATIDSLGASSVSLGEILAAAEGSRAKRVMLVLDAGFGGRGRDGEELFPAPEAVPPIPARTDARIAVWSATQGAEPAFRYSANDRGLFSYLVVGSLRGWADGQIGAPADGAVSVQEAQGYVARVVRQLGGGEQKAGKDTRADVNAWVLSSGTLEAGPSKDDLAGLALVEKARRVRKAEAVVIATAKADWETVDAATAEASAESEAALTAFIARYDAATVTVDGAEVAIAVPFVADARARLDGFARAAEKAKKRRRRGKRRSARSTAPPPPPVATAPCQDLLALEPKAITGELGADLRSCLESRIDEEPLLTAKDKLSRMLMIDSDARGDVGEWTRLAARHLEDFDRSDPELCFKFALVLSRGSIEDGELVLRWADYALENKHVWEGPTYMSRVYNLLRLKAETATRLWHDAEADFIEERTDENELETERYRGMAKDLSREWLDYGRTSAQPVDRAHALCESSSGNSSFCEEG